MARASLHSLTQHLAVELDAKHIRVNADLPAMVQTPICEGFIPKAEIPSALQGFRASGLQQLPPDWPSRYAGRRLRSGGLPTVRERELGQWRRLGCRMVASWQAATKPEWHPPRQAPLSRS